MIIDNFMFFNELDLLEIRLNELCGVVDEFVLIEATKTHTGKDKPLVFNENKHLFEGFNIKHLIVNEFPDPYPWHMEMNQRMVGLEYVKSLELTEHDTVLFSDLDEIFRADMVKEYASTGGWQSAGAAMPLFYYYMNCMKTDRAWFHARWVKGDALESRDIRCGEPDFYFKNCGWHFSFLGDIKEKLGAFAHTEFDKPPYNTDEYIKEKKGSRKSLFDEESQFVVIEDLGYLPAHVKRNINKFSKYICEPKERTT